MFALAGPMHGLRPESLANREAIRRRLLYVAIGQGLLLDDIADAR